MGHRESAMTAQRLIATGKGLLLADENCETLRQRLATLSVAGTKETRRIYRQLLLTTGGIEQYLSGVVLGEEGLRQTADDGQTFPALLLRRSILPGARLDRRAVPLAGLPGEWTSEGLDGMRERIQVLRERGIRFGLWRTTLTIDGQHPSRTSLVTSTLLAARSAAHCAEAGLPIVLELSFIAAGGRTLMRAREVLEKTLGMLISALREHGVALADVLLQLPVLESGGRGVRRAGTAEATDQTLAALRRTVPPAIAGLLVTDAGQSPERATEQLNILAASDGLPWPLTFAFGEALQRPTREIWRGRAHNAPYAQRVFLHRALCSAAAREGDYDWILEASA